MIITKEKKGGNYHRLIFSVPAVPYRISSSDLVKNTTSLMFSLMEETIWEVRVRTKSNTLKWDMLRKVLEICAEEHPLGEGRNVLLLAVPPCEVQ